MRPKPIMTVGEENKVNERRRPEEAQDTSRLAAEEELAAKAARIEACRPTLAKYFLFRVKTREDAEDLLQETLQGAYHSLPGYRGECSLAAWVAGVAANVLKNYYRRLPQQQQTQPFPDTTGATGTSERLPPTAVVYPYDAVNANLCVQKLLEAMNATCTDKEQSVLKLVYQQEALADIAIILNMPADTVRSHFRRGRGKLLAYLIKQDIEHDLDMVGGKKAIEAAWQKACAAPDADARPTNAETEAWHRKKGKHFLEAVLKVAPYLPFSLALLLIMAGVQE